MSALLKPIALAKTQRGQYALIATSNRDLPFAWVENHFGHTRTMAAFVLATEAILLLDHYQRRENRER
jgi:hypothetical protein